MTDPEAQPKMLELRVPSWLARVLLLRIEFPELNHLPEERRREIITKCVEADAIVTLLKRRVFWHRLCWCSSAMILVVLLLLRRSGAVADDRIFFFLISGGFLFALFSLPAVFYLFQLQTGRLLHELVAEELKRHG
jgi:hypothetical protein